MAFEIHWKIPFMSLSGIRYTVNIYKDGTLPSGYPLILKGAGNPFFTEETSDDDIFEPMRTQSGYLSIVDDGLATNSASTPQQVAFRWRDFIPTSDIDRPVTLTHVENGTTIIDWQGFMQAQNFGYRLYENPVERAFPIQCPLTILSREDISTTQKDIHNFAYILMTALNTVPAVCRPNTIIIQGGDDALDWMQKKMDWSNYIQQNKEFEPEAKTDYGTMISDICAYWGLIARVQKQTLYLVSPDDEDETDALVLTYNELANLADGNDDGTIEPMTEDIITIGNIFATIENDDYQNRGPNKSIVKVDPNKRPTDAINPFDDALIIEMNKSEWNEGTTITDDEIWHYTKDILTESRYDLEATCAEGYASFNILSIAGSNTGGNGYSEVGNVIRIQKTYTGDTFVTLETQYEHCFSSGFLRMFADTYRKGVKYENGNYYAGNPAMKMRLGIGNSRATAQWWDGRAWQNSICIFLATIGNRKPELFTRYVEGSGFDVHYIESSLIAISGGMKGRLFVDLLGTDDSRVDDLLGEKSFDLLGFRIEYSKNDNTSKQQYPNSGWWDVKTNPDEPDLEYKAHNANMVKEQYSVDNPFGTNDDSRPGYGLLMNADDTYMEHASYASLNTTQRPEEHLANRIVNYWATSKRCIKCALKSYLGGLPTEIKDVSPRSKLMIDGTILYPYAISYQWRDDEITLKLMENFE